MQRIVVGVDGTPGWTSVVEAAAELARGHGARLQVVQAVPDGTTSTARERLQLGLVRELSRRLPDVAHRVVVLPGRPHTVLRRASDEADLLVVGARGTTSGRRLILGTVAQSLLHGHGCPVLLVRDVDAGTGDRAGAAERPEEVGTFGGAFGSTAPVDSRDAAVL